MNQLSDIAEADDALLTKRGAAPPAPDRLRVAAAALDEVMASAHEAGDWHAVRVLHSLSALLAVARP